MPPDEGVGAVLEEQHHYVVDPGLDRKVQHRAAGLLVLVVREGWIQTEDFSDTLEHERAR